MSQDETAIAHEAIDEAYSDRIKALFNVLDQKYEAIDLDFKALEDIAAHRAKAEKATAVGFFRAKLLRSTLHHIIDGDL